MELIKCNCENCHHSIPMSMVETRQILAGKSVQPTLCQSCLADINRAILEDQDE